MRNAEINYKIQLDENNVPEQINWTASDNGGNGRCKAIMLSMWDEDESNTMRIDLWTKDMLVDDMKKFFHQTLMTMTDTFERATGEEKMAGDMRDFCAYFAEKMQLAPPQQ
ncbi:MAG: gliding motility protein GldC [Bacteroidia bacterium]